jgi:hypothetical protein
MAYGHHRDRKSLTWTRADPRGGHGGAGCANNVQPARLSFAIALFPALLLAACNDGGASSPLRAGTSAWVFQYSPNMPASPTSDGQDGVYFDFPSIDGVHYLVRRPNGPLAGSMSSRFEVVTTGNPQFVSSDPRALACATPPASVSLYIQRQGDQLTAQYPFHRWFSVERWVIKPGTDVFSVPLAPDNWLSVFGVRGSAPPPTIVSPNPATEFAASLASPMAVGMTFGIGCFAGHGIYVSGGTVRMYIRSFAVQ